MTILFLRARALALILAGAFAVMSVLAGDAPAPLLINSKSALMIPTVRPDGQAVVGQAGQTFSNNWSGYAKYGNYTSASGRWTVPSVSYASYSGNPSRETSTAWVGVGGLGTSDLIQTGTEQQIDSSGVATYYAWIEMLPASETQLNPASYPVRPGDTMSASVQCLSSCTAGQQQTWNISISNQSRGWNYSGNFSYVSRLATAEWIMEASTIGVEQPLANFGSIAFSSVRGNGVDPQLSINDAVIMTDPYGGSAAPCTPNGDQFIVFYGSTSNCPQTPTLQVSGGNIATSGTQGATFTPSSFTLTLSATTGAVNYSITGLPNWFTASSTSGTVGTSPVNITISLNGGERSLSQGTYGPTLFNIVNTTNGAGTTNRTATTTVTAPIPSLVVSSSQANFDSFGIAGGPYTPQGISYSIQASYGAVAWTLSGVPSWLTASATSGTATTTASNLTLSLNSAANSLAPGTYGPLTLTFTNTTNGIGNTTRTARLIVYPTGTSQLVVSPTGDMTSSGSPGGPFLPASAQYLFKGSTGSLNFTISGMPSWLNISSTSGVATASGTVVTFSINSSVAATLPVGLYSASLVIANSDTKLGNTTRGVTLSVQSDFFTLLTVPPGYTSTEVHALSRDGSVSVGLAYGPNTQPVRWLNGVPTLLPIPSGETIAIPTAVNDDGSLILGYAGGVIIQWSVFGSTIFTAPYSGLDGANAMSGDGSIVVGSVNVNPARWLRSTQQATILPLISGYINGNAYGVSADGTVVSGSVGTAQSSMAARWSGSQVQTLGILPGYNNSAASAVSPDGSRIAGQSWSSTNFTAQGFLWQSGSMTSLGTFYPAGFTRNGTYLFGGPGAYRWSQAKGVEDFRTLLTQLDVSFANVVLQDPRGLSDDGLTMVGNAYLQGSGSNQAFIAHLPTPARRRVASHDMNADVKSDILWRHTDGTTVLWEMSGAAAKSTLRLGNTSGWLPIGQRDFDGNGNYDILWASGSNVAMWLINSNGQVSSSSLGSQGSWSVVGTGDFDGDGKGDILWRDPSGALALWQMIGGQAKASNLLGTIPTNWSVAKVCDMNGDGKSDIIWRSTTGDLSLWLMNGATATSVVSYGNVASNWFLAGCADFDGNGNADLLWRDTAGNAAMWLIVGNVTPSVVSLGNIAGWNVVQTGDYNGDGKSDILWRDSAGNTAMWLMSGSTVLSTGNLGLVPPEWTVQALFSD